MRFIVMHKSRPKMEARVILGNNEVDVRELSEP
jgi:hypothetical protein